MRFLGPQELIIILVIVLILFGPKRLPQLGKSIGKTMRSIREGAEGKLDADEDEADELPAGKVAATETKESEKTPVAKDV